MRMPEWIAFDALTAQCNLLMILHCKNAKKLSNQPNTYYKSIFLIIWEVFLPKKLIESCIILNFVRTYCYKIPVCITTVICVIAKY